MRLHGKTWAALVLSLFGLLAANLWCWRPGIGGAGPDGADGTEVQLFYGWPATYRAELWRSEDLALRRVLIERAPFFNPAGIMEHKARYESSLPILANAVFGIAALVVIGVCVESRTRGFWRRESVLGLVIALLVIVGAGMAAGEISEHL